MRIGFSGVLVGVLAAFVGWALQWAVNSRTEVTYGLRDPVTTIQMIRTGDDSSAAELAEAAAELRSFLAESSLTLVVTSIGEGQPMMIIGDHGGALPWFPAVGDTPEDRSQVFLLEGTYSAQRWRAAGTVPLLPADATIGGVIAAPRGADDIQFAQSIGDSQLPPGEYVINTVDEEQLGVLIDVSSRLGVEPHSFSQMPLWMYLVQDPLFFVTSLFLGLGSVCAGMFWVVTVRFRQRDLVIRWRHGGTHLMVVRQYWLRCLPALGMGFVAGAVVSVVIVGIAGREELRESSFDWLVGATSAAFVLTALIWLVAVWLAVPGRKEAEHAR